MADRVDTAYVKMWDEVVGAVSWDPEREFATFEYDPAFLDKGLDPAPLMMPLSAARSGSARFAFPALARDTFLGMPGMLADSLPDKFGNRIIDAWLARQGRTRRDFSPVERLCYTGRRGMGALEFAPPMQASLETSVALELDELIKLVQAVIDERTELAIGMDEDPAAALLDIIRVGTSAGGGRPKAVIAYNDRTGEVRSGQMDAPDGFGHWLLKFDGVRDDALGDPAGYGLVEYAYCLMAKAAGIRMSGCRLLREGGRAHFMTRRFDRPDAGSKMHMQSLCALSHFDFNAPGAYAYEQAFQVMRELRLPHADIVQQFRRMVFNVCARNQDDHTKNIAYLMDGGGVWRLAPAFDLTYAYNPDGKWTNRHQMSINGKRDGITEEDLLQVGREASIRNSSRILDEVVDAVGNWPDHAEAAGVDGTRAKLIGSTHRLLR